MSPNNVNDLASSFVQMAKAFEELPTVRQELEQIKNENDVYLNMIQNRENHIISLKAEIEQHLSTIRSLEVARDDAELRFLELDERVSGSLRRLEDAEVLLIQSREAMSPPKPQPEPEVQAQPVDPKPEPHGMFPEPECYSGAAIAGNGNGDPTSVAMSGDPSNVDSWASGPAPDWAQDKAETSLIKPTGQSEPLPTMIENPKVDGDTMTNIIQTGESFKPSGRYSGKRYYDWPTYIPLSQWLDGGGTQADYDWRPGKIASC